MIVEMKTIVLVGNDKIGRKLVSKIHYNTDINIFLDNSSSLSRLYKLLIRRRIGIKPLLLMALAELMRKDVVIPNFPRISNNADLVRICKEYKIKRLFLFRAGLIISKELLGLGIDVFNVHCALISKYGGLASIYRALINNDFEQCATLHRVTDKIDQGEIIKTLPYRLDSSLSYKGNEDIAYEAGINLLRSFLADLQKGKN